MKKVVIYTLIVSCLVIVGCASRHSGIIIDPASVNLANYQTDLNYCKALSEQVGQQAGKRTIGGAVVGGLIGAAIGNKTTAKRIAGAGAVRGTFRGAAATKQEKLTVTKNCLRHKGYTVLN